MTSLFSFSPVPSVRNRADGWTPKKQMVFIETLAEFGIVDAAVKRAGMGRASVYNLRSRPGAESFAAAWEAAQQVGFEKLQDIAMDRAINGECVPYFYKGEMAGERLRCDNRLLIFMMQQTLTRRFGQIAREVSTSATRKREAALKEEQERKSDSLKNARSVFLAKLDLMRSRQDAQRERMAQSAPTPLRET
jgi:hypothetical protein